MARVRFCNWFCESVCTGDRETLLHLFRGEVTVVKVFQEADCGESTVL